MENILERLVKARETEKIYIDYMIRCDDENRPTSIQPDETFQLHEVEKLNETLALLEGCNYDLVIHEYDEINGTNTEFSLVSNNCINQ